MDLQRKLKVDGTIKKFKARLVIQGFRQKSGIDYFDTYALMVRISTIRLLIAMASIHNLIIHQMDMKTAFLNGELDEDVYMNQPQAFIMPGNENKANTEDNLKIIHLPVAGYSCLVEVQFLGILRNKLASLVQHSNLLPISIRCDNAATLAKAYSQMYNGKYRHLGVKHSMIHELITNRVISIEFVMSQQNLAGHLTKGLARDLVIKSVEGMDLKSN
ncbi:zinc finger, CCHC-type containing protein [Tanacetum coccineum]